MSRNNDFTQVDYAEIEAIDAIQIASRAAELSLVEWYREFMRQLAVTPIADILAALPPGNGGEPADVLREIYERVCECLSFMYSDFETLDWAELP